MATKADFTEDEWKTLQKGVMGAGLLASVSDPDFTDTFGEAGAVAKYLAEQREQSESELIRELAHVHGSGFGIGTSAQKVEAETLDALRSAASILAAKAPDDVAAYRELAVGAAERTAAAKGGVTATEASAVDKVRQAVA
jgi:hypothetical protein